jgi:hypothetical protein
VKFPRYAETDSVLRRISGPKRHQMVGDWRKLHNEDLHNMRFSPSIIRMIKSKRMRLAGHVTRMGGKEEKNSGGKAKRRAYT